jgi:HEAT repeat protein
MDKLVEREAAPRGGPLATAPALAAQFFLIPFAVVAVLVGLYAGFQVLLTDDRTVADYLTDIRWGGRERRWPAAYELSRLMADPDVQAKSPELGPALVKAFVDSEREDPRVRRYLALAIGRLSPAPPDAVPALTAALDDADSETVISAIWALGALGDRASVPRLKQLYESPDAGVRKVVVYALGVIGGGDERQTLRAALEDPVPDVQWNAAVALARAGDREGVPVLRRMLDREYVQRTVTRTTGPTAETDPVDDIIISGLRAVAAIRDPGLRPQVDALSREDRSMQVRQAAMQTLKQIGS